MVATGTLQALGESDQRVDRAVAGDAGTRQHHGVTRRLQHVGRPMHLILGRRRVARHVHRQRRALGRQLRDVFGKTMNVAPGRSVVASLNALRIISGAATGSVTMSPHFVMGR